MEYRQLGQSDVNLSVVTFGAWAIGGWMWGGQEERAALEALQTAMDNGITSIDTAPIYGFGRSEELVGRAIQGRDRHKLQILTKYVMRWDTEEGEFSFETEDENGNAVKVYRNGKPEAVIEECERSLKRLGTDYIDLFQCHWRDHTTPVEETMQAIDKLLQQGKIRAAGVSNFEVDEIEAAREVVPIASDQPPYSMVNRSIEHDIVPYCVRNNIGILPYSPLQRGLLTGKVTMDRTFPEGDAREHSPYFQPGNRRKVLNFLEKIRPIAEAHDATLAQLVINWTVHRPGITAALVGARNGKQAEENAQAAAFKLTADQTEYINAELDQLDLDVDGPF